MTQELIATELERVSNPTIPLGAGTGATTTPGGTPVWPTVSAEDNESCPALRPIPATKRSRERLSQFVETAVILEEVHAESKRIAERLNFILTFPAEIVYGADVGGLIVLLIDIGRDAAVCIQAILIVLNIIAWVLVRRASKANLWARASEHYHATIAYRLFAERIRTSLALKEQPLNFDEYVRNKHGELEQLQQNAPAPFDAAMRKYLRTSELPLFITGELARIKREMRNGSGSAHNSETSSAPATPDVTIATELEIPTPEPQTSWIQNMLLRIGLRTH